MGTIIQLENIIKSYGNEKVLSNLNLRVESGRFYVLLGQNGAGKSTLMKVLTRTEIPQQGNGIILGSNLLRDPYDVNAEIGYVSEGTDYQIPVSIEKLGKIYSKFYAKWSEENYQIYLSGLKISASKNYDQLSRGLRMQVALAIMMAAQPKLLVLDEITSVLDAGAREFILSELSKYVRAGGTVIMSTNTVSEVHAVADSVLLLQGGRIQLNCSVQELFSKFNTLKKSIEESHPIFSDPDCVFIGTGHNQISFYLVPSEFNLEGLPEHFRENRQPTLAETFVYFTRKKVA